MSKYRPRLLPLKLEKLTKQELIERIALAESIFCVFQEGRMRAARRYWRKREDKAYWREVTREEMREANNWWWARASLRSDAEKVMRKDLATEASA